MKRLTSILFALCLAVCVPASNHYSIYPVPHFQSEADGQVTVSKTVYIVASSAIDEVTVARAKAILEEQGYKTEQVAKPKKNNTCLLLGIYCSGDIADAEVDRLEIKKKYKDQQFWNNNNPKKYDRYLLDISADKKGVAQMLIAGDNTDAVFCGLATLKQRKPDWDSFP